MPIIITTILILFLAAISYFLYVISSEGAALIFSTFILIFSIVRLFLFLIKIDFNSKNFVKFRKSLSNLKNQNKFKLFCFTIIFTIPSKIWSNNSMSPGFSCILFLIGTIFHAFGNPAFFIILGLLFATAVMNLIFALLYEKLELFRSAINSYFFDNDSEFAEAYFDFFFYNMYSTSYHKIVAYVIALFLAIILLHQYFLELTLIDELARISTELKAQSFENLTLQERYEIYLEVRKAIVDDQGFITKLFGQGNSPWFTDGDEANH